MLAEMDYSQEQDRHNNTRGHGRKLLSDFFIATPDQYEDYDGKPHPMLIFPTVLGRGVDLTKLLQLLAIVGGPWTLDDPALKNPDRIRDRNEMIPGLAVVHSEIVEALAAADDAKIEECARAWVAVGDWMDDATPPSGIPALLKGAARLARRAKATGCNLYLYLCWA